MRSWTSILILTVLLAGGCAIPPQEKSAREQALKAAADQYIQRVLQDDWAGAFSMTEMGLAGAEELRDFARKSWVPDGVLTGGVISSMAWISDDTAKVKINWSFQTGTVPSFSSETFAWRFRNKGWKLAGRVLR